jgi:pimeloyl-ACP methyl ester carboxylesterase
MGLTTCLALSVCCLSESAIVSAFSPAQMRPTRVVCRGQKLSNTGRLPSATPISTRLHLSASSLDPESYLVTGGGTSKTVPLVRRKFETFVWSHNGGVNEHYNINYRVEGPEDGPPILLIHGFGANLNHFRYQFPALAKAGYRVYAIDLLGFGASDKPGDVEYSIELFVALLKDFITTMQQQSHDEKQQQWVVAGNSIGGLCSLSVAEHLPDLVRGVVLFNCSGGMTGFRYEDVPWYVRPILYFVQRVVLGRGWMGGYFFSKFRTRETVENILCSQGVYRDQANVDDELLEVLLEPGSDEGAETVFLKTIAGPPGPTPEAILPNLHCPVIAIWGGDDPWTPYDGGMHPATEFHRFVKEFELVVLPGVGHCPHDEAPDKVNSHMISWMKALGDSSTKGKQLP